MSIRISLIDTANNCAKVGAVATLTLKSGVQYTGELERSKVDLGTEQINFKDGGYVVIDRDEIAAVEARPA